MNEIMPMRMAYYLGGAGAAFVALAFAKDSGWTIDVGLTGAIGLGLFVLAAIGIITANGDDRP